MVQTIDSYTYETYQGFLRTAIHSYWNDGKTNRLNFLSLLFASSDAWKVALAGTGKKTTPKKILTSAAGATIAMFAVKRFLAGPIGLLLTGASLGSLSLYYSRNHKRIWQQQKRYRELIVDYRDKYTQLQDDYEDGRVRLEQRDLMIEGLLSRFIRDMDKDPDLSPAVIDV